MSADIVVIGPDQPLIESFDDRRTTGHRQTEVTSGFSGRIRLSSLTSDRLGETIERFLVGPALGLGDDLDQGGKSSEVGRGVTGLDQPSRYRLGLLVQSLGNRQLQVFLVRDFCRGLRLCGREFAKLRKSLSLQLVKLDLVPGMNRFDRWSIRLLGRLRFGLLGSGESGPTRHREQQEARHQQLVLRERRHFVQFLEVLAK